MAIHIKHLVKDFIKESYKKKNFYNDVEKIIKDVLDEKILKYIKSKRIYKNRLIFYCDNSSTLYEFNLKKNFLIDAIKKKFQNIEDIKIKIK